MRRSQRSSILATVVVALVASGCSTAGDGSASPPPETTAAAPASPTESEAPVQSAEPVGTIPSDCLDLLDPEAYQATFGDTPLNDPAYGIPPSGVVEPREPDPAAGLQGVLLAATQLQCAWGDPQADITGLSARFGQIDPAVAQPFFDALPADGFTCSDEYDGQLCQRVRPNPQYPVEEGATHFLRDGIYINVVQANFPTDDLLGDLVDTVWSAE